MYSSLISNTEKYQLCYENSIEEGNFVKFEKGTCRACYKLGFWLLARKLGIWFNHTMKHWIQHEIMYDIVYDMIVLYWLDLCFRREREIEFELSMVERDCLCWKLVFGWFLQNCCIDWIMLGIIRFRMKFCICKWCDMKKYETFMLNWCWRKVSSIFKRLVLSQIGIISLAFKKYWSDWLIFGSIRISMKFCTTYGCNVTEIR